MKNTNLDKKVVVDHEKCIQCGRCADICWNKAMRMGPDGYPYMSITELTDEWNMCWDKTDDLSLLLVRNKYEPFTAFLLVKAVR